MVASVAQLGGPVYPGAEETAWSMAELWERGFRYVLAPSQDEEVMTWLQTHMDEPVERDDHWAVWLLADTEAAAEPVPEPVPEPAPELEE